MNFFNDLKVSLKLSALVFIAFIALSIVGFTGYYYLQTSSIDMNIMYADRLIPVQRINENRAYINRVNGSILELMLTTDEKKKQELKNRIDDQAKKINANFAEVEKSRLDPKGKDLMAKVKISLQKYREIRIEVINLALANKNAEAYVLYVKNVDPLATEIIDNLSEFSEYYAQASKQLDADNQVAATKAMQITISIIVVSFVILGLIGFFITKMITKPLTAIVLSCEELATGDFRDKPRRLVQKDEIGQLADVLGKMKGSLRTVLKQVNESAEQVAASSEELTASAEQSAQASNQVAASISEVATGAEKQVNAINETTAILEKMTTSLQQVDTNTNLAAEKSTQAVEKSKIGSLSVTKAVNQMIKIEQTVNNSAKVVTKLGERSKEIGQIVDTISGIAGQTNLLALNAAIEAARAGEQGRGFAVVADEVRKLAEQSHDAAKKIAALINEIQGDTDKAVIAMSEGTREVEIGTEVVTTAGHAFEEIAILVTEVSNQVKQTSAVLLQMESGSRIIVSSVKEVDSLSKKASGEAQTVSAATEEQSASMEEIASSSQSLAKMAQDLQEAVSKFRV